MAPSLRLAAASASAASLGIRTAKVRPPLPRLAISPISSLTSSVSISSPISTLNSPSASLSARIRPRLYPSARLSLPSLSASASYSTAMAADRPTGLKATTGIELLTFCTPNGYKASILLEELKAAYGTDYTWQSINISQNIQKEPWFLAVNPNGRIPAIVDHDRDGLAVFEGSAILNYLVRRFDTDFRLSFDPATEPDQVAIAESWIGWQHGGVGPMQGQANHFLRFAAAQHDTYAVNRYVAETERLYGVLEAHLAKDRDYVAGRGRGRYSIADIALLGWASIAHFSGVDTARLPHVRAWVARCVARPATARGFQIPIPSQFADTNTEARLAAGGDEVRQKEDATYAFLAEAQQKHNYKYTTP